MTSLALQRKIDHLRGLVLPGQATQEDKSELAHLQNQNRRTLVNLEPAHSLRRKWKMRRNMPLTGAGSTKRMQNIFRCRRK